MLKRTLFFAAVLSSAQSVSAASLNGTWICTSKADVAASVVGGFSLEIKDESGGFVRKSVVKAPTGIQQVPELEFNTLESGTFAITGAKLTLTPTDADLEVIKGHEIMNGNAYEGMKRMLLKEEVGVFHFDDVGNLVVYVDEGKQTNTCIKK